MPTADKTTLMANYAFCHGDFESLTQIIQVICDEKRPKSSRGLVTVMWLQKKVRGSIPFDYYFYYDSHQRDCSCA